MNNTQSTIEILNDLIEINNDRINGCEHAKNDLKEEDADLKYLLNNMITESRQFKMELATEVAALGKDIETGSSVSGTLHRTWLDVKAAFTGHSVHNILEECEFGEDAILKAYKTALEDENAPAYIKDLLVKQQGILQQAHDHIKALRDRTAQE